MSRPSQSNRPAPWQRRVLARQRKSIRFDLTIDAYQKLLELASLGGGPRPEPLIVVVERLIREAELPGFRGKFVRVLPQLQARSAD